MNKRDYKTGISTTVDYSIPIEKQLRLFADFGIDFVSLDKQLVYTVLLLLSPTDKPERHLEAMEKIFRYLQQDNFRKFLRQSETAEQINELLLEADEKASLWAVW